jgi:hypothetical protein
VAGERASVFSPVVCTRCVCGVSYREGACV